MKFCVNKTETLTSQDATEWHWMTTTVTQIEANLEAVANMKINTKQSFGQPNI